MAQLCADKTTFVSIWMSHCMNLAVSDFKSGLDQHLGQVLNTVISL